MNTHHPIKKKHEPVPHDPRNEPLPEGDKHDRSRDGSERKVRKEDVDMKGSATQYPTGKNANEKGKKTEVTEDEYGLPTGTLEGSTTRGSRPETPADPLADRSDGKGEAQRGRDRSMESDPIDPKL